MALAGCNTGHDYEDNVQNAYRRQNEETNAYHRQQTSNDTSNGHSDLEIQGLFTLLVDEGVVILLYEPYNQRPDEAGEEA